jgi:3-phenylpropionate/trans-cinnamate dioxygenase ferredoxin reductase component
VSAPESGIVIVGAGLAGVRTAQALRGLGYPGRIRLLSDESEDPYDRPPLSKDFLTGKRGADAIRLLKPGGYADQGIELVLGARVTGLDPRSRTAGFADGTETAYDQLAVATGARPRPLEALPASPSVHYLRTADDARRLYSALAPGRRVAVIGGGFIGLEVASAALSLGCAVTVVEAVPLPLAAVIGAPAARWLVAWHSERKVSFCCGSTVLSSAHDGDGTTRLRLSDGSDVHADVVVVGVGIVRETGWLAAAGLDVHLGLVCDAEGRTSRPGIVGAGDIMCLHDARPDGCRPVAHWTAAAESAERAARTLAGDDRHAAVDDGYFWSDQGDLRLQFAGHATPDSAVSFAAGSFDEDAFTIQYITGNRLTGVLAVNSPRAFLRARIALRRTS